MAKIINIISFNWLTNVVKNANVKAPIQFFQSNGLLAKSEIRLDNAVKKIIVVIRKLDNKKNTSLSGR